MNEFWQKYLKDCAVPNKRLRTVERDISSSKNLLPVFGSTRLDAITKDQAAQYQAMRAKQFHPKKKKKPRNRTINIETNLLVAMLNRAVDWEIIPANPLARLKKLREDPPRTRYLKNDEWERLSEELLAAEDRNSPDSVTGRLRLYVIVQTGTMCRPDELCNLETSDVDFGNRVIIIRDSKTHASRTIEMSPPVYDALREIFLLNQKFWPNGTLVFPTSAGKKSTTCTFNLPFRKIIRKLGFRNLRRYDLRHTGATWLVKDGCNVFALQELMGHKDIGTTRRYVHFDEHQRRAAIDSMTGRLSVAVRPIVKRPAA